MHLRHQSENTSEIETLEGEISVLETTLTEKRKHLEELKSGKDISRIKDNFGTSVTAISNSSVKSEAQLPFNPNTLGQPDIYFTIENGGKDIEASDFATGFSGHALGDDMYQVVPFGTFLSYDNAQSKYRYVFDLDMDAFEQSNWHPLSFSIEQPAIFSVKEDEVKLEQKGKIVLKNSTMF